MYKASYLFLTCLLDHAPSEPSLAFSMILHSTLDPIMGVLRDRKSVGTSLAK
jgi:hypothetical protein